MDAPARFPAQLQRLKAALGVEEDRAVAAALGMTPTALALRKRRDAFPEEQLIELAASRPELRLDVVHIVTGATTVGLEAVLIRGQIAKFETAALRAELRASRDACMAQLVQSADRMSLNSLHTLVTVAERMATADAADNPTASGYLGPSAPASTGGGKPEGRQARKKGPPR